ncbi:MAG: heme o synthase [Thiothrix sp.]|nr:heme o synthase [Thiothrix sp.]
MQIAERISPSQLGAYYECCKPKVVYLILFTAFVGMLLSTDGMVPLDRMFWGLLGIGLAAAAGAALNHVIDEEIDQRMERTRSRPVAQGILPPLNVVMFACTLAILSTLILLTFVNTLTALLTLASMVGYAIIYTLFLKRSTPQNIVIGGAAGAAPPVLGWTAITGDLTTEALLLFLIIFVWTPPHFWALAIRRQREYANVGLPMLPVTHGIAFTKLHILLYTILLVLISVMPFLIFMSGMLYLVGAMGLGAGFIYYAWKLYQAEGDGYAMQTFGYSIFYLTALFAFLLADHYLRLLSHHLLLN